jgi:hypothetical protein
MLPVAHWGISPRAINYASIFDLPAFDVVPEQQGLVRDRTRQSLGVRLWKHAEAQLR